MPPQRLGYYYNNLGTITTRGGRQEAPAPTSIAIVARFCMSPVTNVPPAPSTANKALSHVNGFCVCGALRSLDGALVSFGFPQ